MKTYNELIADSSNYVKKATPEDFREGANDNNGKTRVYEHIAMGEKRTQVIKDVMSGQISRADFVLLQKKMRGSSGFLKYLFSPSDYYKVIAN